MACREYSQSQQIDLHFTRKKSRLIKEALIYLRFSTASGVAKGSETAQQKKERYVHLNRV